MAAGWESYLLELFEEAKGAGLFNNRSWGLTFNSLMQAVSESISSFTTVALNSNDIQLISKLTTDAGVFSAFKNHQMQNELVGLLTTDGEPASWHEFKQAASGVIDQYNVNWLKTEYNQALSEATMAKKWDGFVRDKELYPHLEYRAVMDAQTRSSHEALNGIILPIDHPFWNTHLPPIDWGCRCDVIATDRPVNRVDEVVASLRELVNRGPVAPGFDHNPGKDGKLFSNTAGYYQNVSKTIRAQLTNEALEMVANELHKLSVDNLKEKKVSWENLHILFPDGSAETKEENATVELAIESLVVLQNVNNIQTIVRDGKHTKTKEGHSWKMGKHIVNATETEERKTVFTSLTIEP